MHGYYLQQKRCQTVRMWEYDWWSLHKTHASAKSYLRENFPDQLPFSEWRWDALSIGLMRFWSSWTYVLLLFYFSNIPPLFKLNVVSKDDFGFLTKKNAENNNLTQHKKLLLSSFHSDNWALNIPLFLCYLKFRLVCKKNHFFVQYLAKSV